MASLLYLSEAVLQRNSLTCQVTPGAKRKWLHQHLSLATWSEGTLPAYWPVCKFDLFSHLRCINQTSVTCFSSMKSYYLLNICIFYEFYCLQYVFYAFCKSSVVCSTVLLPFSDILKNLELLLHSNISSSDNTKVAEQHMWGSGHFNSFELSTIIIRCGLCLLATGCSLLVRLYLCSIDIFRWIMMSFCTEGMLPAYWPVCHFQHTGLCASLICLVIFSALPSVPDRHLPLFNE